MVYYIRSVHIQVLETWNSKQTNSTYPSKWRIRIQGTEFVVTPTLDNQELILKQLIIVEMFILKLKMFH